MRSILLTAAAALLAATPAPACDSEAMSAELTAVCRAAFAPAAEWASAVRARSEAAEAAMLDRALLLAREACDSGDPAIGAREAARIARLTGRIEARIGAAAPIWPERLASN